MAFGLHKNINKKTKCKKHCPAKGQINIFTQSLPMSSNNREHGILRIATTLLLVIGAIVCVYLLGNAFTYKSRQQETIMVTGSAEQHFESDLIVWNASYSRTSRDLQEAFTALKLDEQKVRQYLSQMQLNEKEVTFSSVRIEKLYNTQFDEHGRMTSNTFAGFQLTQSVKVESNDIQRVDKVSREITSLIQQGVEMNSEPPAYYYTKLSSLKIDLLAKASEDGYRRAETIAKNAGVRPGKLRKASMGIFQITGQNEIEAYSYGGAFNTSSLRKTATITVRMEFDTRP
jgi:hypothetical protein